MKGEKLTFHAYSDNMPAWAGWYENEAGECRGFLARDGKLWLFDETVTHW